VKTESFSKQVPKNLVINIFSFLATAVIGLWLTPYLLKNLGIVAYGLIPLAMFLSQYVSIIVNSINMSIGRFLLIALQKDEMIEANKIFNTSLVIIGFFIVLQALFMAMILWDITYFFTIPKALIIDATWLFGLTFIGFSISLFRAVFATSLFAYNRLDILRIIDIFQNLVRVGSIIVLFIYDSPSLKYIGMANLLASLVATVPTWFYFKQYTPLLKVKIRFFSKEKVKELSSMSLWILINQVGVLLLGNIDLYLVNTLLGAKETGEYAIVLQFTMIFKTFLTLLSGVLTPVGMIYYANGEVEKLKEFIILSSKIMVIIFIVPLSFIISFSSKIILLWLGDTYIHLSSIISFSLLFFIVAIPVIPLFTITMAYNKVKFPAIVAVTLGIFNVISIYILCTYTNINLWGIVSTKLIIEIIFSLFILYYVSDILSLMWYKLFRVYSIGIGIFFLVYMIIKVIKIYFIENIFVIFLIMIVLEMLMLMLMSFILLDKKERYTMMRRYPYFR